MSYVENMDREWCAEPKARELSSALGILELQPVLAVRQLEALAAEGSALAMLYLGDTFANARGVTRDVTLGFSWYQKAAGAGSIEAAHRVAFFYYHRGMFTECLETLTSLSKGCFIPSIYCLGLLYFNGTGVSKDIGESIRYWNLAAANGHLNARRRISIILRSGEFGLTGRLAGFAKLARLFVPYMIYWLKYPSGDRLRGW
ncbi:MAG: tetratricopeptide repeat protein [Croceibacterium sp.]